MPAANHTRYRFALLLALFFVLQLVVMAAVWLIAGSAAESGAQTGWHWAALAGLAVAIFIVFFLGLRFLLGAYIVPISRLTEDIALLPANPGHRVSAQGAPEIRELIGKINDFASAYHALDTESQAKIACASHALTEERNRLAALISDLASGVLVCNMEGRVLLYNRRARQLLQGESSELSQPAAPVGLGRSLYGMIDRAPVTQALEQVRRQLELADRESDQADRQYAASASFVMILTGGRAVRVNLAPVLDETEALDGFVLVLDDINEQESGNAPRVLNEYTTALGVKKEERPVFYDFDLFKHTGQNEWLSSRPLAQLSYTVFDSETTGLHPAEGDEIISIGAVRIVNGRLLLEEYFDRLIRPRCTISAASVAIHGITDAMLQGQPRMEEVLPQFARFVEDTVLVAHNAAFDLRFLQMQEEQTGVRMRRPILDTLLLSQVLHPNQAEHSLEAIANRLGVEVVGRHTALGDAIVTAEVFLRMLPLLAEKGIHTLGQAHQAEQQTGYARLRY